MTQPSPTLTPVVGAPATITRRAQLTGIITYDGPYQGGSVGAGLGSVPIAWDATLGGGAGGWKNTNTNAALTLPLARADVTGASAPTGWLVIDLTWVDESGVRQSDQLRLKPIAGADGVLDLTRDQTPTAVVATPDLVTAVQQAAQIPEKIQQVDTAVAAIPGQVSAGLAPVAPALAGIAQQAAAQGQASQQAITELSASLRAAVWAGQAAPVVARGPVSEVFAAPLFAPGALGTQRGWTVDALSTATLTGSDLTVAANVINGRTGAVSPYVFGEGRFRVLIRGDANTVAIMWGGPAGGGQHYAVWCGGPNLETGHWRVFAGSNLADVVSKGQIGTPGGDYWVEVSMGPAYVGSGWEVRAWGVDNPRPETPTLTAALTGSDPLLSAGPVQIASLGPAARVGVLTFDDFRAPNAVTARAALVGPWVPRYERNAMTMATMTSGSELRSRVEDTPGYALGLSIPPGMTYRPVWASRYREVGTLTWSAWIRTATSTSGTVVRVDVVSGLDSAKKYDVQVCVNVHESDPHWQQGAGVCVREVIVAAGGTCVPTPLSDRLGIEFVGDSIVQGVVALGYAQAPDPASIPATMVAEQSFAHVAADYLNAVPLHAGYGGTGVTVSGSGGMPRAEIASNGYTAWLPDRHYLPRDPDVILIEHGINDHGASTTDQNRLKPTPEQFRVGYRSLILSKQARNPAARIICMRPFNGGDFAGVIAQVAAEMGLTYIDTTGWAVPGDFVDGTHPSVAGAVKLGTRLGQELLAVGVPRYTETAYTPAASGGTPTTPTTPADEAQFATYTPGTVDGQQDWRVRFGGSGQVTGGNLRVDAEVAAAAGGVTWERSHTGTRHTVLVRGSAEKRFMYKWRMNLGSGQAYAVWCANSTQIEHGHVANVSGGMAIPNYQNGPAVPTGGDYYVEVQEGAGFPTAGSTLEIRTWAASGSRPSSPSYTYTFSAAGPAYAQGTVALNSIGAPAVIGSIVIA